MALVINAKVIRAMEAEQVKEMVLRSAAFDNNADGGCALPMKQLSGQLFDEDPERILSVLAITKSPCITPPNPDTMMVSPQITRSLPGLSSHVCAHCQYSPHLILCFKFTDMLIHDRR